MGQYAYVGCRTTAERKARGKGIKVYRRTEEGEWEQIQLVEGLTNPSYLCTDRTGRFVYTVHGDRSEISAFRADDRDGTLSYINTVSAGGVNPVHLSADRTNRWIFVANLQTGNVSVLSRREDGGLGELTGTYYIPGRTEGSVSHPHQVMQDQTGAFLAVSCQGRLQGTGQVAVFRINSGNGSLEKVCAVRSREIAEPRHLVFHPNNRWCYGVNEKDYSVTFYQFDEAEGRLEARQILPTLPDTYTGDGWASGIILCENGRYVVVSNRRHDSLTSFRVEEETGKLRFCSCVKTGGQQPRFITEDPWSGRIIAANELSDTLTEFCLDPEDGSMYPSGRVIASESPVCVIFRQDS